MDIVLDLHGTWLVVGTEIGNKSLTHQIQVKKLRINLILKIRNLFDREFW